ncbi:MAG: hypothetical protein ACJAVS_000295 [Paracoccaceae bacterium]
MTVWSKITLSSFDTRSRRKNGFEGHRMSLTDAALQNPRQTDLRLQSCDMPGAHRPARAK